MNKIVIYGASGHGKVVADIARSIGYNEIFFIDDGINDYDSFESFLSKSDKSIMYTLGIGDNKTREKIFEKIKQKGCKITSLVHKSAIISPSAKIGQGSVIMPGAIINFNAKIGEGTIVNSASVIEHECVIEDFVHISPNAALGGNVKIGKYTHIGIGSAIIQNISIGSNVIVGGGSVVIRDVKANQIVAGNPIKKIRDHYE